MVEQIKEAKSRNMRVFEFVILTLFACIAAAPLDSERPSAPKKPADHPKYINMIIAAITVLNERTGSSRQAIVKYIKANYKVGDNASVKTKMALKRGVASGVLAQPKGTGASGSFKVVKKAKK